LIGIKFAKELETIQKTEKRKRERNQKKEKGRG
jgi:hypothetical protein